MAKKKEENSNAPQIEYVLITELSPHPKNPRKHPAYALKKLSESIKLYGFTQPVIISKDNIILAGHARCLAAKMIGMEKVPCIRVPLDGMMADAYLIADNQTQQCTEWDETRLESMLKSLDELEFDLSATFLEEQELAKFFDKKEKPEKKGDAAGDAPPDVVRTVVCPKCGRDFRINTKKAKGKKET